MTPPKQKIRTISLDIDADTFWNWLADTVAIDLHDLHLVEVFELNDEVIRINLDRPAEPTALNA